MDEHTTFGEACYDCTAIVDLLHLIDYLVAEIQHLEIETVRARYEL